MISEITSEPDLREGLDFMTLCMKIVRKKMGDDPEKDPFMGSFTFESFKSMKDFMKEHIYALEEEGRKVGYISIFEKMRDDALIFGKMMIHPDDWEKDYKNKFLDFVVAQAKERGAKRVRVSVIDKDAWSQDWYKSQGFSQKGVMGFSPMPFEFALFEKEI